MAPRYTVSSESLSSALEKTRGEQGLEEGL
jgi:hypothetical protein